MQPYALNEDCSYRLSSRSGLPRMFFRPADFRWHALQEGKYVGVSMQALPRSSFEVVKFEFFFKPLPHCHHHERPPANSEARHNCLTLCLNLRQYSR